MYLGSESPFGRILGVQVKIIIFSKQDWLAAAGAGLGGCVAGKHLLQALH